MCGGGEVWRQLVEGDKEERICFCGGKRRMPEETIINKHFFNYEGRFLGERNLEG